MPEADEPAAAVMKLSVGVVESSCWAWRRMAADGRRKVGATLGSEPPAVGLESANGLAAFGRDLVPKKRALLEAARWNDRCANILFYLLQVKGSPIRMRSLW